MGNSGDTHIEWTSERSLRVRGAVPPHTMAAALHGLAGLRDVVPTDSAVDLVIDPLADVGPRDIARRLASGAGRAAAEPRQHEIPVRYGGRDGPDLAEVAKLANMTEAEVIAAHTSASFVVAFLGFAPGFGYLTGLPERLRVPRLASPRPRLEAGSVGLAGPYTGVYALPGPGGWQIIGRTDAVMFGVEREEPALLRAGDVVRFVEARP